MEDQKVRIIKKEISVQRIDAITSCQFAGSEKTEYTDVFDINGEMIPSGMYLVEEIRQLTKIKDL